MNTLSHSELTKTNDAISDLYRRINWRILPILMLCYFFACLDRQNISFAKLQMQHDLAFSDAAYGLGAGIFFIGYALFEVPSNLMLPRVGARRTICRILILWGLTSAAMMFVSSVGMFYFLRFLLGVFEAGFAPGMLFYLTYWYGESRMARAVALVLMAGPISGVLGGPLSAWIMTETDGAFGLSGWQWMFFLEGIPCVFLGFFVYWMLSDKPSTAKWLNSQEVALLERQVPPTHPTHKSFKNVLRDPKIYLMAGAYFCIICGIYTVNFWLPSILKANGVQSTLNIGLITTIPYIAAIIGMVLFGRLSDKKRERRWHSAIPAVLAGISLCIATWSTGNLIASVAFMTLATLLMYAAYVVFWAIPSEYLKGDVAAGGIAFINTIGVLGGFFSPTIIGWATSFTGSMNAGLYVMVILLIIGGALLSKINFLKTASN